MYLVKRVGIVNERPLQHQAHQVALDQLDAVLRERRSQDVPAQRFATCSVTSAGGSRSVQGEIPTTFGWTRWSRI